MEPKVSVIIPVYNAEKYIKKCINSILKQTYEHIEIIIINDGSKDRSEELILQMQQENKDKIQYQKQENKGVSQARNYGIQLATGKYLMFVDNDDYIDQNYIETFVKKAEEEEYDLVIGGYRRTNEKQEILYERILPETTWGKYITITPWARIYRRDYIVKHKIEFLTINIGEDIYFNLQAITLSDHIAIINYVGYNWFDNCESVSNTVQKNLFQLEVYPLLNNLHKVLQEKNCLEKEPAYIELFFFLFIIWLLLYTGKNLTWKELQAEYCKLFDWMRDKFPHYKKNALIGFTTPKGEMRNESNKAKIIYVFA